MEDLAGKRVIVTGGGSGIGEALVRLASNAGAESIVLDYDRDAGESVAAANNAEFRQLDVSDPDQWEAVVESLGVIDYAALNAGIMTALPNEPLSAGNALTVKADRYKRVMAVNVDGVLFGLRSLLPVMNQQGGCITVTASMAGLVPIAYDPIYAMSKHAVVGLVRSLAETKGPDGRLRVNSICPGGVATALVPQQLVDLKATMMDPEVIASEIIDLWQRGAHGEVRVRLHSDLPAEVVSPPELTGM